MILPNEREEQIVVGGVDRRIDDDNRNSRIFGAGERGNDRTRVKREDRN